MLEKLSQFADFFAVIAASFWHAYTKDSQFLFERVADAPLASGFEAAYALFLVCAAGVLAFGVVRALIDRSPLRFLRPVETFVRFFGYVGAWVIVALILSMVYEVVSRYFFGAPTKWAFEVAYMMMGTSFMLGIAFCLQMQRHIRVDFVYDHVSLRARAVIDLVGFVVLIPMLLWLCTGLWDYFHEAYKVGETSGESAWNPIIWPFKFAFVMGFVLLLMQTVAEILKALMALAGVQAPPPPEIEAPPQVINLSGDES